MINLLTDDLPTAVLVDGDEYEINTDFRNSLLVIMAFEDPELAGYEKQVRMLTNLYPVIPSNVESAVKQAVRFLDCGEEAKESSGAAPHRFYSFVKDQRFIYAAFRQTHGIDLSTAPLHWWQFVALFMDLGSETTFCSLTSLRQRVKSGKGNEADLEAAQELGDLFEVPDVDIADTGENSQADEFMRLYREGQKQ